VMMNEARLGTGLQGLSIGTAAYQAAVQFAHDRLQGRSLTGTKSPELPADSIMVHPDVRRMLLEAKAFVEGGQAFTLWTALQADLQHSDDAAEAQKAHDYMGLITPVLKAYLTDKGFHVASLAMQVHGGSGYTEHFTASQSLRDARITMIYEGANGIQALDLVGRKNMANGGQLIAQLLTEMASTLDAIEGAGEALNPVASALRRALSDGQQAQQWLLETAPGDPHAAGSVSVNFMMLFGYLAGGWMMARSALQAQSLLAAGSSDSDFLQAKLLTVRFYCEQLLPRTGACLAAVVCGSGATMGLNEAQF
jgi:hypothetical protein